MTWNGMPLFSGWDSSTKYYSRDHTADKVALLSFSLDQETLQIVISANKILQLVPSSAEDVKVLPWSEWGPTSTRCFREYPTNVMSAFYSWIYISGQIPWFVKTNNLSLTPIDHAEALSFDFNPRIICRRSSRHGDGTNQESSMQFEKSIEENLVNEPESQSNLIAQYVITEESVIQSPNFTEDIHSSLPFRVFIKKYLDGWVQCSSVGEDPFAVFTVSGHRYAHKRQFN